MIYIYIYIYIYNYILLNNKKRLITEGLSFFQNNNENELDMKVNMMVNMRREVKMKVDK